MSRRYFGTDGVRGVANTVLTVELATQLGIGAGNWLKATSALKGVALGSDTRRSSPMLSAALTAGFCSVGVDVYDLGVVPTPTVSFVTRTEGFGLGAIVSASHNPAPDNGIKFVGHDGRKLPDAVEETIEGLFTKRDDRGSGDEVGQASRGDEGIGSYLDYLETLLPERLDGWLIAMDAAHGAAYRLGPEILSRLGAQLVQTGVSPDGLNINAEGGATKPETICELTKSSGAKAGVALDGDADRAIFSDERGRLINGDRTMAAWAAQRKVQGLLEPSVVVATVMSNGGFERYLTDLGITLERAPVGDKYVAQRIAETGSLVGGEQSGHIIFSDRGPTGDGLITMLEFLRVLVLSGKPASEIVDAYEPWPQLLVNVGMTNKQGWEAAMEEDLSRGASALEGRGRLVVRASGTQPMIRVMVEADEYLLRDRVADEVVNAMLSRLGGEVHGRVDLTHALGD